MHSECSDGPVSHLRMSLPRSVLCRCTVIATVVGFKRHEGVNAFNLVYAVVCHMSAVVYLFDMSSEGECCVCACRQVLSVGL